MIAYDLMKDIEYSDPDGKVIVILDGNSYEVKSIDQDTDGTTIIRVVEE